MSKLALFLLFFVLVSNATFLRPWENATWIASNPNIVHVGTHLWWNLPELQKTLDSVDLPASSGDKIILDELEKAYSAKNAAKQNYGQCMALPELAKLWSSPAHAPLALFQSFGAAASCIDYQENWKKTVDHSLNAIELSEERAINSISQSRISFERVEHLGICNVSFTARPDGLCNLGRIAFLTQDSALQEGDYGGFTIYRNYSEEMSEQLRKPTPDLSSLGPAYELLWGKDGTISLYDSIQNKSRSAEENAENQYGALRSAADKRKTAAASKISELKRHRLYLVDCAPSSSDLHFLGTVAEHLQSLQLQKNRADLSKQEAELSRNYIFSQGHLANAISQMNRTAENYSDILSEADSLSEAARLVVDQQKEIAALEIKKSSKEKKLTPASIELLDKANQSFNNAKKSTLLGIKYERYSESSRFARLARSQRSTESQILIQSSLSKLKGLINKAKKDEIDVTSEKQTLSLLSGLEEHEIDSYIQSAISDIISKAKVKYEHQLVRKRKELIHKIRLGGAPTQDLQRELMDIEAGIVRDGQLQFPESIGRLKALISDYQYLDDELQIHIADILGNAMSTAASPVFSDVYLDSPVEIYLDVTLSNPLNFGASNFQVPVTLPFPVAYLYSDVETGKDSLSGLYTDGDQLLLTFTNISKYETKRITMKHSRTLAHTMSKTSHAIAIGNGVARVKETLEFELDTTIPHLELLQGYQNATIDGTDANRPLDEGRHILETTFYVADAYSEKTSNIKTYPIGPKSQVEYTVTITPKINLDKVPVLIEPVNTSEFSAITAYAITGEKTTKPKKLSEMAYSVEITGLTENVPAKIQVAYLIEDSKSYSESLLKQYQNADLAPASRMLYGQAQAQIGSGNYSKAISLLKQLKDTHKKEQAQIEKNKKKAGELSLKLDSEISDLEENLPLETNSPFLNKLLIRKNELEKTRSDLSILNLTGQLSNLESIDFRWLGKELKSYAKTSYKEYNDLKERFYLAGNSSSPQEFAQFETSLNRFQASPQIEYAVGLDASLNKVRAMVENQESLRSIEESRREDMLSRLSKKASSVLGAYEKQYSSAKGTDYSGRFIVSVSIVEKQIKRSKSSIDESYQNFREEVGDLNASLQKMTSVLSSLENESASSLGLLDHLIASLPESDSKSELRRKLTLMRGLHESGEYVNSLRAGSAISDSIKESKSDDGSGLLILGISAIAILAVLAFYMLKPKGKPMLKKVPKLGDF